MFPKRNYYKFGVNIFFPEADGPPCAGVQIFFTGLNQLSKCAFHATNIRIFPVLSYHLIAPHVKWKVADQSYLRREIFWRCCPLGWALLVHAEHDEGSPGLSFICGFRKRGGEWDVCRVVSLYDFLQATLFDQKPSCPDCSKRRRQ